MDNVVAVLTKLQAGQQTNCDRTPGKDKRLFSTLNCPDRTNPASYSMSTVGLFPRARGKAAGR